MAQHAAKATPRAPVEREIQLAEGSLVQGQSRTTGRILKRAFDVIVSLGALVLFSPILAMIAVLIKLDSPGPILYRGKRIGKDGQPFWMFKFRTMKHVDVDAGPRVTAHDDVRITHIGGILRDTKLNELPQFLNVLKGDMSLVGPRPEDPKYVALYTPQQRRVLSVPPGITSVASIVYRDEEKMLSQQTLEDVYVNVIMPDKLQIDLAYVEHGSFLVDLDILVRTSLVLLPRFAQAAPEIEEIFFGPVQRLIRRHLSWFVLDLLLAIGAVLTARFIWWRAGDPLQVAWPLGAAITVGVALTFTFMNQICGLHRSMWGYASGQEIIDILMSASFSTILLLITSALTLGFPVEMISLCGFFAFVAFTTARYRSRVVTGMLWRWRSLHRKARRSEQTRLLIVGAGTLGEFFAYQVQMRWGGEHYEVVGFVDDDLTKRGMRIHGVEVLGGCRAIPSLVRDYHVDVIVLTTQAMSQLPHQAVLDLCQHTPAKVQVLPDIMQLVYDPQRMRQGEAERQNASMEEAA